MDVKRARGQWMLEHVTVQCSLIYTYASTVYVCMFPVNTDPADV